MRKFWTWIIMIITLVIGFSYTHIKSKAADAYDLSQWQQSLSTSQIAQLKHEVKFLILRVQYGSSYQDTVFKQNVQKIAQAKIPYGVYSYARYQNMSMAQLEARQLYQLAPNAKFYVNDVEEQNTATVDQLVTATRAWSQQMRQLTTHPTVLYSYQSMLDNQLAPVRDAYDTIWIANYTQNEPNPAYHYDLWQFTDKFPSAALNQNVDASVIPSGGRSLLNLKPIGKGLTPNPTAKTTRPRSTQRKTKPAVANKPMLKSHGMTKPYYDDTHTVFVQVINPHGLELYDANTHQKVKHIANGRYLLVNQFFAYHNGHYALGANHQYYSALKSDIAPITNSNTLKQLQKTLHK